MAAADSVDWGRACFEAAGRRPQWIGLLIEAVATDEDPDGLREAAACALDEGRWQEGKRLFDRVRAQRLQVLNTPAEVGFALAEAACAVAYTASGPDDPFDHDWGWIAAGCAVRLAAGRPGALGRLGELGVRQPRDGGSEPRSAGSFDDAG